MVGKAREDMAQVSLEIEAVEFGGRGRPVDGGASLVTTSGMNCPPVPPSPI
jgi:hypothetical protein